MSEELELATPAVAPRKPRSRKSVEVETPEYVDTLIATDDKDDYEIIRLHDNKDVPPGGQPFGVNGRFFVLRPNVWTRVPSWLLSTIDNCVADMPVTDDDGKLIGTRPMRKYPYEVFRG